MENQELFLISRTILNSYKLQDVGPVKVTHNTSGYK
jgi:hypothetical protein